MSDVDRDESVQKLTSFLMSVTPALLLALSGLRLSPDMTPRIDEMVMDVRRFWRMAQGVSQPENGDCVADAFDPSACTLCSRAVSDSEVYARVLLGERQLTVCNNCSACKHLAQVN